VILLFRSQCFLRGFFCVVSFQRGGKSAGADWFHMTAPTLTAEVKADLKMVALRGVLDPKRHYKKDKSLTKTPQFFQLGTVVAGAAETYSARLPKAQRRQRLVDEILADAQHRTYIKRRYLQIQDSRQQDPTKRRFKTGAVGGEKLAKRKKEFQ
jgi:hypothetical protein